MTFLFRHPQDVSAGVAIFLNKNAFQQDAYRLLQWPSRGQGPAWGMVSVWEMSPGMQWGRHPRACGKNSWHTLEKTLPFPNYWVVKFFLEDIRPFLCYLILLFQILGTFLAYVIICVQFAQGGAKCDCSHGDDEFQLKTNGSNFNMTAVE